MTGIFAAAWSIITLAAAEPAPAHTEATFRVRNSSQSRLMCGLRLERGNWSIRFSLDPGRGISDTRRTFGEARVLTCASSPYRRTRFRIRAGQGYELRERGNGELRIRAVGS